MEYRTMESPTAAASAFSKKLVNSHSFAGKSLYDGVFAAPTKAHSGVEDYGEIFGGPASSIPFLDVPELNDRKVPVDVRRSKLDYSEIFGGFGDFEFAVSHEELLGKPKKNKKAPSKTRSRSRSEAARPSGLPGTDQVLLDEASNEVIDGVKEYKMLYNKTRSMGKSEVNGVTHVAELRAVPGYAHVIDENGPAKMKGTGRPVSSVLSDTSRTVNFGAGMMENGHHRKLSFDVLPAGHGKQTSGGDGAMQNKFSKIQGTDLSDRLFEAYDTGSKFHQEKEVPHASKQSNAAHRRGDSQVSMDPKFRASSVHSSEREAGVYSPTYLDEEVDENSDAAASAAAVRKAIEEAQVRIKLAREMMERKKEGHQPRMKSVSESVKKTQSKQSRVEVNVKKFGETENSDEIALPDHTFAGIEKPNVVKAGLLTPDLDEKETLSSANEAVEVIHSENLTTSEANHRREGVQELESEKETDEEKKSFSDHEEIKTSEEQTEYENKLEAVSKSQADFEKLDSVNGNYGLKESEDRLKSVEGIQTRREDQTGEKLATSLEQPELKLPRKLEPWEANFEERWRPAENMRELEVLEKENKDDLDELKDVHRWVDNQTSNNSVLKHEGLIKSENGSEMEENAIFVETLMLEEFQRRLKEACLMAEHVDVLEVCGPTENEVKQVMCNADINEMGSDEPEKLETGMAREVNFIKEEVKEKLEDAENHDSAYRQEDNDDVLQEKFNTKETDVLEEISEWGKTERLEEEIAVGAEERKAELADQEHHVHENNPFNYVHKEDNLENEESFAQLIKAPDFVVHEVDKGITEETEAHSVSSSIEGESKSVELCNDSKGTMEHHAAGLATVFSESEESIMQMENAEDFLSSYKIESSAHTAETYLDQPKDDHHSQESDTLYRREGHLEEVDCESGESNLEADDDEVAMAEKRSNHDSESSAEGSWADDRPDIQDSQTSCAAEMEGETKEIDKHTSCAGEMKVETKEIDNQASCAGEMKGETKAMDHIIKENQDHGNGSENDHDSQSKLEKEAEDCYPGVVVLEKENKRKIDEAEERKREKEKERIVVERAIREARERAFAEACERAEKAAAEKANQAYRKVTSEARGKLEKGSGEANDKAFLEAKLKAERAAVERATEEARERALEKALSEKTSFKSRNQAEKLDADKFYGSFRDNVTKQRVNDSHKGSGATGSSGHSSAANQGERFDGTNGESAQRCKARMERHRRTAERAAKALEEKNMRDLRAQREQAERNRLAESLDAEVKRWSSGKEKNLRALLSTLQYILGPDSGWQPIPLTDIIATAAVKKAYRKATLAVHPDKLQQRGASIQQKYICEKVFDLLKEAWNKFNAEER